MRPRLLSTLVLAAALAACSRVESAQSAGKAEPADSGRAAASSGVVVLRNVTVIDGTGAAPRPGMTVVVSGGRIAEIHPADGRAAPAGAQVLELAGHYVIPGLIDSHVHLGTRERPAEMRRGLLRYALLGGVTSVRDMGGRHEWVAGTAAEANRPDAEMARVFFSAAVAGPAWFADNPERAHLWEEGARRVTPETDLARLVSEAKASGATGLKVYTDVAPETLARLAAEAKRQGMRVWAHAVVPPARPGEVARSAHVLSHADQLVWAAAAPGDSVGSRAIRPRLLAEFPPASEPVTSLLEEMREQGVLLEPTLTVMMGGAESPAEARRDPLIGWAVDATRHAAGVGVPIVAGTDALGGETPNIHLELQLLVEQAGLTPMQALEAATRRGAEALGAQDSLGTVQAGKLADLVVLRADPLADIRNTQTVVYVLRAGRLFRRTDPWELAPLASPPP